jgi:hypothetical protein
LGGWVWIKASFNRSNKNNKKIFLITFTTKRFSFCIFITKSSISKKQVYWHWYCCLQILAHVVC